MVNNFLKFDCQAQAATFFSKLTACMSILLIFFVSFFPPTHAIWAQELDDQAHLLRLNQNLLKEVAILKRSLIVGRSELEESDPIDKESCKEKLDDFKHQIDHFFQSSKKLLSQHMNLICVKKKYCHDQEDGYLKIFAVFELRDERNKNFGFVEQSYLLSESELIVRLENVKLPPGVGLGKALLNANLELLKNSKHVGVKKMTLEAETGKQGFIGAYVWAKMGFQFSANQCSHLQEQLSNYIQYLYPYEEKLTIKVWILKQHLTTPQDFLKLIKYTPQRKSNLFLRSISCASPKTFLIRRLYKKNQRPLGKAFLMDPYFSASWGGEIYFSSKRV